MKFHHHTIMGFLLDKTPQVKMSQIWRRVECFQRCTRSPRSPDLESNVSQLCFVVANIEGEDPERLRLLEGEGVVAVQDLHGFFVDEFVGSQEIDTFDVAVGAWWLCELDWRLALVLLLVHRSDNRYIQRFGRCQQELVHGVA
jgi:hypothetical protein